MEDIISNKFGVNFFYLISVLDDYERTIEYYKETLLNEKFMDLPKSIILHIIIGYNYFHLLEYDQAFLHYGIAFSALDKNNQLRGHLYVHIGDIWRTKGTFGTALAYYGKALKRFVKDNVDNRDVAKLYRKVSDVYLNRNNSQMALIYKEQADQIDQEHYQRSDLDIETSFQYFQNHLDASSSYPAFRLGKLVYSKGLCLMKKSDYQQALKTFLEAKKLFESHLPPSDEFVQTFTTLYDSMALVYLLLQDNFNTLIMLKKSIDIRTGFRSN